tara:strand:+ start:339 stop:920 length:582 start_codon:yes stop_codon:yes gene_type:complete
MKLNKYHIIFSVFLFSLTLKIIPIEGYIKSLKTKAPPEIILVLGGDINREFIGANLAKILNLPLVVSGGSNPEYANWSIEKIGLKSNQFFLDYRAKDTLTNFTSLVDEFHLKGISHALLITSHDHMRRASNIGNIIAGSRGIKLTKIPIPCEPRCQEESKKKQIGDIIRAITWVITGQDLKSFRFNKFTNKIN